MDIPQTVHKPKWAREIERFLPIKPQFLLYGNIGDVFPAALSGSTVTLALPAYLTELLKERSTSLVVLFEPLVGLSLVHGDPELFKKLTNLSLPQQGPLPATLERAAEVASALSASTQGHTAMIMRFASRLNDLCEQDAEAFFYRMHRLSSEAVPRIAPDAPEGKRLPRYNPLFWIMDKENDLPPWYLQGNPRIRVLPLPRPDNEIRSCIIEAAAPRMEGFSSLDPEQRRVNMNLFCDQTTGLLAEEIVAITQLAWHEKIPFARVGDAISRYKLGIQENMWDKLDKEKIRSAETFLNSRVMGQGAAVRHASDILKRSRFNLSGSQFSRFSQRPKGILFLAGPTGVGKTELAKAITELIFGSSTHYIRFDMSEFGHEHANQRLVGAPPGYVGYDVGGELTNAVKQNPFSVVLFDEIEKAHPRILDIFLQILDDGRLTSGRGETVYFSECLIIFTSNLGMYEQLPDGTKQARIFPEMPYDEIGRKIDDAIGDFFKYKINRPEILNRIGKNIVVFDFIRQETAKAIFKRMMDNILFRLADSHNITIRFTPNALEQVTSNVCADLSMGGRGIGSNLEAYFMNPLSRLLSETYDGQQRIYEVQALRQTPLGWELDAQAIKS